MDPSGSSFSPRNLIGTEEHSEDPYHVADNICKFASGGFEGMVWSRYQHHGPQMKAAPIDIPFERTVPYPLSMPPSSSSAPLEEQHLTQLSYATTHDQYAGHELPVVGDFRQGFMDDMYGHCSQPLFGEQWLTIPEDDFLVNLEQDAIAYWEPYSVAGHQHLLATGSDVMMDITPPAHIPNGGPLVLATGSDVMVDITPPPHTPNGGPFVLATGSDAMVDITPPAHTPNGGPLVFKCKHHTGDRPCGMLVDGDILHALEHFSRVHVQPMFMTSGSHWICRWGGKCDAPLLKGNWRRHVMSHLVRWMCSNCLQTYARDDYARKHAKDCGGNRHIFMVPQLDDRPA